MILEIGSDRSRFSAEVHTDTDADGPTRAASHLILTGLVGPDETRAVCGLLEGLGEGFRTPSLELTCSGVRRLDRTDACTLAAAVAGLRDRGGDIRLHGAAVLPTLSRAAAAHRIPVMAESRCGCRILQRSGA